MASSVSQAGATGDIGSVLGAAATSGSAFAGDPGTASIIAGAGKSAGKVTNAGISGDVSGVLSGAAGGAFLITGQAGTIGSSLLNLGAEIDTAVNSYDTAVIVTPQGRNRLSSPWLGWIRNIRTFFYCWWNNKLSLGWKSRSFCDQSCFCSFIRLKCR